MSQSNVMDCGAHLALVRRITWCIMTLGSCSCVWAPGGRGRRQLCSLIGKASRWDSCSSGRGVLTCVACGRRLRRRQGLTLKGIYTGWELWDGGRWGRGKVGHAPILKIAWAKRMSSVLLIIVDAAIEMVTIKGWWPISIGAWCSAAVPIPRLRGVAAKPVGKRWRQPTYVTNRTICRATHVISCCRWGHPVAAITWETVWRGPGAAASHAVTVATVPSDWTVFRPVAVFPADKAARMISHSRGSAKPTGG